MQSAERAALPLSERLQVMEVWWESRDICADVAHASR